MLTATANSDRVRHVNADTSDRPVVRNSNWEPKWKVDVGDGGELGLAIDDGCFVVLYPHADGWRPGTHIPKEAASKIANLINGNELD